VVRSRKSETLVSFLSLVPEMGELPVINERQADFEQALVLRTVAARFEPPPKV
jgi:hypothetical protein